jgi:hypothetical protein
MLYRLEQEQNYFLIKHVETDREVGYAFYQHPVRPDGSTFDVCRVYNNAHRELATATSMSCQFPIRCAAITAATYQEHYKFPDLEDATWNVNADRVERRLGTVLADTAWAFARAFCEASGEGLTAETTDKFATSLAELASIWWVSRVGSFDANTRREVAYFANPLPSGPRLTFSGAAQAYGMRELRARYPDISDAERQKLLDWVLQWLSDALSNELEEQKKDLAETRAWLQEIQNACASPINASKVRRCHS